MRWDCQMTGKGSITRKQILSMIGTFFIQIALLGNHKEIHWLSISKVFCFIISNNPAAAST